MNVKDIKKPCNWNDLDLWALKKTVIGRLLLAENFGHMNFTKINLEELTHMQIFAQCISDNLPSLGKHSELQKILHEHVHDPESKTTKKNKGRMLDLDSLVQNGLNTQGAVADFANCKKPFQEGDHDKNFEEMGMEN